MLYKVQFSDDIFISSTSLNVKRGVGHQPTRLLTGDVYTRRLSHVMLMIQITKMPFGETHKHARGEEGAAANTSQNIKRRLLIRNQQLWPGNASTDAQILLRSLLSHHRRRSRICHIFHRFASKG